MQQDPDRGPSDHAPSDAVLEQLRNDARYARERLELYRAKSYSSRPTSVARLRELQRAFELASARLEHATRAAGGDETSA